MGNRHILDERYEEGTIHIDPEFIKVASEGNLLEFVASEKPEAILGGDFNIYIRIRSTNYVLMHIKENHYIVINRRVRCKKTGRWVHVARRFANGFHFGVYNGEVTTAPRVKHKCKRKTLSVYRIIMSYSLYGCVDGLISTKDVHHVEDRYFNTIGCLRYVDERVHRKYHSSNVNGSKRAGYVIKSSKEFIDFLKNIKRVDEMASIMPM